MSPGAPKRDLPFELDYIPARDDLTVSSEGDLARHMVVRVAFTRELRSDKRIAALCKKWATDSGFGQYMDELAETLDKLAQSEGLPGRKELAANGYNVVISDSNRSLAHRGGELAEKFHSKFFAADWHGIRAEARDFVVSLELPWPWLQMELVEIFVFTVLRFISDTPYYLTKTVKLPAPSPADIEHTLKSKPGESPLDAAQRFKKEFAELMKALEEKGRVLPRGKIPKDLNAELEEGAGKYGRWLYLHRFRGYSMNRIAKESGFNRKTVRYGLDQAVRLLGINTHAF